MHAAFTPALPTRPSLTVGALRHPATTPCTRPRPRPRRPCVYARAERRAENVPGEIFVDSSCIDCDACRWIAPGTFRRSNSQSAVHAQPSTPDGHFRAMQAAAACPTGSIRTAAPSPDALAAARSFPTAALDADGRAVEGVFYNGFAAQETFGASSWLVATPQGNVMFDCPRFAESLARNIERMGGLRYIVLSHRDDVAWHARWAARFGAARVIHEAECFARQGTHECETRLRDADFEYELLPGLRLLHVPGHTSGSVAMLHEASKSLFSGDHLAYSATAEALSGFPMYCQYSWGTQAESVRKLAEVDFLHGYPGHGRAFHFADAQERRSVLEAAVEEFGRSSRI